ncbi:MAG TPA: hypothetical protein VF786_12205 [Terriglobales bacterium]
MSELRNPAPDLLRRFVPTPFKLIAGSTVLETNDLDMLDALDGHTIPAGARDFTIHIVRDTCSSTSTEQRLFESGHLRLLTIGLHTMFLVDRKRRRSYAFLASDFPASRVPEVLRFALQAETPRHLVDSAACSL